MYNQGLFLIPQFHNLDISMSKWTLGVAPGGPRGLDTGSTHPPVVVLYRVTDGLP